MGFHWIFIGFHGFFIGFHGISWTFMEISWDFMGFHWSFMGFSWDYEFWSRAIKASSAVTKGYITKNDCGFHSSNSAQVKLKPCADPQIDRHSRYCNKKAQFLAYIPISVRYIRYRLQIHASYIYIYYNIYIIYIL